MENASKALLIAAAVLVVIILVAIGMKIYSSTTGTQKVATDTGITISDKTKDATDIAVSEITQKYVDPFNYGSKTRGTVIPGDDITISKGETTETFRVISNDNGKILAIPHYNLIISNGTVKQATSTTKNNSIKTSFSDSSYWSQISGWNNNPIDGAIDIDMTVRDGDKYKNNIQEYFDTYKKSLQSLGAQRITVRACKKQDIDTSEELKIRNPSKTGRFWLGSAGTGGGGVFVIDEDGGIYETDFLYSSNGLRPVIEIY